MTDAEKLDRSDLGRDELGFTLIEALIAMVVLSVGVLAVIGMQTSGVGGNARARAVTEAANYATDKMEFLLGESYSSTDLSDADADGVLGLSDSQCCQDGKDAQGNTITNCTAPADGCDNQGQYDIYWNVSDDDPVTGAKTIKVLVRHRVLQTPVTIEFVKAEDA